MIKVLRFLKQFPWRAIIIAWLTLIAIELTGNLLVSGYIMMGLLTLLAFLIFSLWLYKERQAFLNVYSLYRHECEPHEALLLLVSPPNLTPTKKMGVSGSSFPWKIKDRNGNEAQIDGVDLQADINALNNVRWWNWQQILRALIPHKDKLKIVYLIGSPSPGGSFPSLGDAKELIERYIGDQKVFLFDEPIDFEDFDKLVNCLKQLIKKIREMGIQEKDIIIDITGGKKTASIAGAMVTLNTRVTFQYVDTEPPFKIWAYDVAIQSPLTL